MKRETNGSNKSKRTIAATKERSEDARRRFKMINAGKLIHDYRKKERYRLKDVAKACGVSPSYISDIEHGRKNLPIEVVIDLHIFYGPKFQMNFDLLIKAHLKSLHSSFDVYNYCRSLK